MADPAAGDGGRRVSPGLWRWGWPLFLLAMAAAVPLLVWLGWSAISGSSDGTEVGTSLEPTDPGYRAFVDPTPTLLLIHGDHDGLDSLALLALTDDGAEGAVVLIAPGTITSSGSLSARWVQSGSAGLSEAVAELLGIRPGELQVVDDSGWGALASATVPVVVNNPDVLVTEPGEIRFDSGQLQLAEADVGPYLGWQNPGESPLVALFRQELFWEAWLNQVASSSAPDVIPGETDRGIGRFGRALAMGEMRVVSVPGLVSESGSVALDAAAANELVQEVIPFPLSASGGTWPSVQLLNGDGDFSLTKTAARALSRAGARITIVGNAAEFGWQTTQIVYHDLAFAAQADAIRDALGTGEVMAEEAADLPIDIHITVTLGADFSQISTGEG